MKVKEVKMKKFAESDESSESNESWCNKGSDYESLAIQLGQLDLVTKISDLKPGDYILVNLNQIVKKGSPTIML